jgi:two-component system nitrate/nitrite response regulator NarL
MCILGGNTLFREGLKSLLAGTEFRAISLGQSFADLAGPVAQRRAPQLMLFRVEAGADDFAQLRAARRRYPDSRIVVITPKQSRNHFADCLAAGVDGYIDEDVARQVLVDSLRLVQRGMQVFPTAMVAGMLMDQAGPPESAGAAAQPENGQRPSLSAREREIAAILVEGASNKSIANRLRIKDTTVKVHMRRIQKKIGVSNRTQIAVWAANNGLGADAPAGALRDQESQIHGGAPRAVEAEVLSFSTAA